MPRMPYTAAGALTRVGGNTTEATTTSTTIVDLLAITGLSIATPLYVHGRAVFRKTAGAAAACLLGIKLNTTGVNNGVTCTGATSAVESGYATIDFIVNVADYLKAGVLRTMAFGNIFGNASIAAALDIPAETITDINFRGRSLDAANTFGIDEAHIYTYAVS